MRTVSFCALLVGGFLAFVNPALSKDEVVVGNEAVPAFEKLEHETEASFELLPQIPAMDVEPLLINGTVADRRKFPAIVRMTTGGTCTASIVGPAAILIAAHCVDNPARISFVSGTRRVVGICQHAPGYLSIDKSQDWAMCLLRNELSGFPYESVDIDTMPTPGDQLVLTGYGCTQRDGPLDGLLRVGFSMVVSRPAGFREETSTIYTSSDLSEGEAVLCPGDSGGPIFRFSGGLNDSRKIVGVNSRTTFERGVSLFSATASVAGADFLKTWAALHNQKVCGVNLREGCK
ncbi:S1 family peptidase [Sinorhizobium medicae]|uniref:S1 family peptidase n=1 Tax=Sinorhizobium medicae TaxID=110321 RepID=UPI000C7E24D3|nr:S1 family peptidase [Sinorhizobium medicae]MDX0974132.1 trypsin-like serine protease [Sinorhizobium medicae]MDX1146154.1 trypsin-like serine protease [Sinorhizobium medicae]PLU00100.1 hypothetical protein BMJ32_17585 [Sinorhizobium medicae]PLU51910.1 hypothetical protein BMJ23_25445 [Sinorhizobium medicae]PLU61958.1 hypothetical protein BMJ21_30495 [Sinorhizobium medicae]